MGKDLDSMMRKEDYVEMLKQHLETSARMLQLWYHGMDRIGIVIYNRIFFGSKSLNSSV